jgi:hypothetical protein
MLLRNTRQIRRILRRRLVPILFVSMIKRRLDPGCLANIGVWSRVQYRSHGGCRFRDPRNLVGDSRKVATSKLGRGIVGNKYAIHWVGDRLIAFDFRSFEGIGDNGRLHLTDSVVLLDIRLFSRNSFDKTRRR